MELTENNDLFKTVLESSPDCVKVLDAEGRLTFMNFNGTCIMEIDDFSLLKNKSWWDLWPELSKAEVKDAVTKGLKGETVQFEAFCPTAKGTPKWWDVRVSPMANAAGVIDQLISVSRDITEKRNARESAEMQQRLYETITNNTPDLIYVFSLDYKFTYANKALLEMWGKTAEDAIGKGLRENGYEEWHAQMHEREIDSIIAGKKSVRGTVSFPHAELGSRIYDYILKPVVNEKGEVEAISGITRDITELKKTEENLQKSEARFRNLLQEAPMGATLFQGPELIIEIANTVTQKYWGKDESIIGKPIAEAAPELEEQQQIEMLKDMYARGGEANFSEVPISFMEDGVMKNGYYTYSVKALYDNNGKVESILSLGLDVTEQVLIRKKIEESEAKLKSVIDQTPAPTLVLNGAELVIEQINAPMLQLLGRGEEVIGMPLIKILPELEGQYVWEQVQKVYKEGTSFDQSEVLVPHNRGGEIADHYYNVSYRPRAENGKITGMIQVAIDVTEQVTARKKLEESENRFRALVNASSDVVYSMNADWTVMRQLEGRGFLTDTGEPIKDWMEKYINVQDREMVSKAITKAIKDKTIFELEHRVVDIEGAEAWTFSRAIPMLDDKDEILEWFGAAGDITEKKNAENALRASEQDLRNLVLQSPVGICVMDADTLISEIVNDKFVEIAGKKYEEIMGRRYWDAFAEAAPYYGTALQDVIKTGKPFYANEVELMLIRHEKEEVIYVTFVYESMKDSSGVAKKVVVWVLENTLQVNARQKVEHSENRYRILSETLEQQVEERTKELQRSNEDLQQFAHVASHDLKEPVRKVKTFMTRLENNLEGKLDEEETRFISRINVATDRMITMIDGVLAYSTMNANIQTPELVDLNDTLKSIETDLEISLQRSGAKMGYENLPVLEGAPVLLYQLFYNLVNNSIKFSKEGVPPVITVSSAALNSNEKDIARIIVRDNGIGFEDQFAERIFDTFSRLNSKDKYEGTGLGLSLCKKIVERHGGTITAESKPGEGAVFIITLPLRQKEKGI